MSALDPCLIRSRGPSGEPERTRALPPAPRAAPAPATWCSAPPSPPIGAAAYSSTRSCFLASNSASSSSKLGQRGSSSPSSLSR